MIIFNCSLGSDWVGPYGCLKRTCNLVAASNGDSNKSNAVAKAWKHAAETLTRDPE